MINIKKEVNAFLLNCMKLSKLNPGINIFLEVILMKMIMSNYTSDKVLH